MTWPEYFRLVRVLVLGTVLLNFTQYLKNHYCRLLWQFLPHLVICKMIRLLSFQSLLEDFLLPLHYGQRKTFRKARNEIGCKKVNILTLINLLFCRHRWEKRPLRINRFFDILSSSFFFPLFIFCSLMIKLQFSYTRTSPVRKNMPLYQEVEKWWVWWLQQNSRSIPHFCSLS